MTDRSKFMNEDGSANFDRLFDAYSNLESKLGQQSAPPAPAKLTRDALIPFFQEVNQTGKLSDASYKNLEDTYGLDRGVVDEIAIEGQQAKAMVYRSELEAAVGGKEEMDGLIGWAKDNLPDEEKQVLVRQVDGGALAEATAALRGLAARRAQAGHAPAGEQLSGTPVTQGALAGYASMHELSQAVGDPKFGVDAAYTNEVNARVERTDDGVADVKSLNS